MTFGYVAALDMADPAPAATPPAPALVESADFD
jgi:hypothetical protein